jgi:hypothetical protein
LNKEEINLLNIEKIDFPNVITVMPGPCSIEKPHIEDDRFKYNVTVGERLHFFIECYD